jgi:RHS repeat-associated protein
MAMSVVYTNFAGRVVSETRGGVEKHYQRDTLGSTAALVDNSGNVTDRFEYWPYGEISQRTGTTPTPFTFVGTLGYFMDILNKMFYVRARYLRPDLARWQTVDPLWPEEPQYGYASEMPILAVDSCGLAIHIPACAIPCAPCLACAGAMLAVCPPGEGWTQCVTDVWEHLPSWTKWTCGIACGGCFACFGGLILTGTRLSFIFARGTTMRPFHMFVHGRRRVVHHRGEFCRMASEQVGSEAFRRMMFGNREIIRITAIPVTIRYYRRVFAPGQRSSSCVTGGLGSWLRGLFPWWP